MPPLQLYIFLRLPCSQMRRKQTARMSTGGKATTSTPTQVPETPTSSSGSTTTVGLIVIDDDTSSDTTLHKRRLKIF